MKLTLYFFTSFFLINSGILLIMPLLINTKEEYDIIMKYFTAHAVRLILGGLCFISAVLKLFFPFNDILIVGDIIPLASLALCSLTLLLGYIQFSKILNSEEVKKGAEILRRLEIPIGFISITAGIIHIFLPNVIFL